MCGRPDSGRCARSGLEVLGGNFANSAIDSLAKDVGMSCVSGVLLDHVQDHGADRGRATVWPGEGGRTVKSAHHDDLGHDLAGTCDSFLPHSIGFLGGIEGTCAPFPVRVGLEVHGVQGDPYSWPASLTASQSASTRATCLTRPPSVIELEAVVARMPGSSSPEVFQAKVRRFRSRTDCSDSASLGTADGAARVASVHSWLEPRQRLGAPATSASASADSGMRGRWLRDTST